MTTRIALSVLIATLVTGVSTSAQSPGGQAPLAGRFVDPANGLSLEQAIARAIEQEPSLRAARSQVDVAQGMRVQASLRPNPSVSFERREEPGGTDNQTTVGSRVAARPVPEERPHRCRRPRGRGRAARCRGSRASAGGRSPHAVWRRPGDDSGSRALRRARRGDADSNTTCCGPASKREPRRRSSAICWMSSCDACRPIVCCRQAGPRPPCSS